MIGCDGNNSDMLNMGIGLLKAWSQVAVLNMRLELELVLAFGIGSSVEVMQALSHYWQATDLVIMTLKIGIRVWSIASCGWSMGSSDYSWCWTWDRVSFGLCSSCAIATVHMLTISVLNKHHVNINTWITIDHLGYLVITWDQSLQLLLWIGCVMNNSNVLYLEQCWLGIVHSSHDHQWWWCSLGTWFNKASLMHRWTCSSQARD